MRLVDADELSEELSKRVWYEREDEKQAVRIVKEFPTVDAVEVVRCKDCKWFAEGKWCRNPNNDMVQGGTIAEWFCADGKRREEDE